MSIPCFEFLTAFLERFAIFGASLTVFDQYCFLNPPTSGFLWQHLTAKMDLSLHFIVRKSEKDSEGRAKLLFVACSTAIQWPEEQQKKSECI